MERLEIYQNLLKIKANVEGILVNKFEFDNQTDEKKARSTQYLDAVKTVCTAAKTKLLETKISRNEFFPISSDQREPIVFSGKPEYDSAINEFCALSVELGLSGAA